MINKIQATLPVGYTSSVSNVEAQTGSVAPEKARQVNKTQSAEVSLSSDALAMQGFMQAVKDAPDVRVDLVQEIKGSIEAVIIK
jgi:anti-sigma28 factor (negative regulator of flagellin synthesis)